MSRFKQYIIDGDTLRMLEIVFFLNEYNEDSMNEDIMRDIISGFKTVLSKIGLKPHKTGKGLLQILTSTTKNVSKIIFYAFKVSQGEVEYKDKIKELSKKVKKEDILDVLLRLDILTLHAITGPIHILDALTGWHIGPNLKQNALKLDDRAKKVLGHMKELIDSTVGETKTKLERFLKQLKNNFKFSSQFSTDVLKNGNV